MEPSDINGYDWDWMARYGDEVIAELADALASILFIAAPEMAEGEVHRLAMNYATVRAEETLPKLAEVTRERIFTLTEESINRGDSLQTLAKTIREDFVLSKERAVRIARTETTYALGEGQKQAAIAKGQDEKKWVTQGDDEVAQVCRDNEKQGWIPIADAFQSGVQTIPGHIQCRCTVIYRRAEKSMRRRCPDCHSQLVVNKDGTGLWCRKCQKDVV